MSYYLIVEKILILPGNSLWWKKKTFPRRPVFMYQVVILYLDSNMNNYTCLLRIQHNYYFQSNKFQNSNAMELKGLKRCMQTADSRFRKSHHIWSNNWPPPMSEEVSERKAPKDKSLIWRWFGNNIVATGNFLNFALFSPWILLCVLLFPMTPALRDILSLYKFLEGIIFLVSITKFWDTWRNKHDKRT